MINLHGEVAIVTGGGRGLGRSMAATLIDAGASVTVAARTAPEFGAFVAGVKEVGGQAQACPTDMTNEAAVKPRVAATVETFGRVDVRVNNSGIVASTPLLDQSAAEWDRVQETNLRGTSLATRTADRHVVAQGAGKVINIASNFALQGITNHAAYLAAKVAIIGFSCSMAREWARAGVPVNAIAPGYFATPLNAEIREDADTMAENRPSHPCTSPRRCRRAQAVAAAVGQQRPGLHDRRDHCYRRWPDRPITTPQPSREIT